jgi:DNA-binding transcriptional ArsR family regulator
MELIQIYECLCDPTRLRLLNVLAQGPLCVCHFQEILDEPQVKISKHLAYLRARGLVEVERHGNWMVYALPARPSRELRQPGVPAGLRAGGPGFPARPRSGAPKDQPVRLQLNLPCPSFPTRF